MDFSIANVFSIFSGIASIVTAVAAWKRQNYERESLSIQKRLFKNQDSLPLMKSTVKILVYPLKSSNNDFNGYDALIAESNVEKLGEMGVVLLVVSIFF